MANSRQQIPHLGQQPPAVDFIDTRLKNYHIMFDDALARSHYDPREKKYMPNDLPQITVRPVDDVVDQRLNLPPDKQQGNVDLPARPVFSDTKAMGFWNDIFEASMTEFKTRSTPPKKRSQTRFDIRQKTDWNSVYNTLEEAKDQYCQKRGLRGSIRNVWHRVEDNITPVAETARIISHAAPDNTISTPILGVVVVIFKAIEMASKTRHRALEDLGSLVPRFAEIEFFIGMFPKDQNIKTASVELTIAILHAVECGITFFTSNELLKGGMAVFTGEKYQENLIQSLENINTKSILLKDEAEKSQMWKYHIDAQEQQSYRNESLRKQDITLFGINHILVLLNDHEKQRAQYEARLESQLVAYKHEIEDARGRIRYLEETHRDVVPTRNYMSQEALQRIVDVDNIDIKDMATVSSMTAYFSLRGRAQAEQVTQTAEFKRWLVSATSSKLLIHWEPYRSKSIGNVSPLSLVCGIIAGALKAQPRFIPLIWFGGRHVDRMQNGIYIGQHAMVKSLIEQLLRYHQFDMQLLPDVADFSSLESLNELLAWLVSLLPPSRTLCCIVDGVVLLERDEYAAEAISVLVNLVRLASNKSMAAPVKVLFTTTHATVDVRGAFDEESIMNVGRLPRPWSTPSEERMIRELGGNISDE